MTRGQVQPVAPKPASDVKQSAPRALPPRTLTQTLQDIPGSYGHLAAALGPELVARLLDLERDMGEVLEHELPGADADRRRAWAGQLAFAIATDGTWFAALMQPRPGQVAQKLDKVHQAARALLTAIDDLPSAAVFGMHMRLLEIDLSAPAARQALTRELVFRTIGRVEAGLNRRKAGVAELALAASETRDGFRGGGGGKPRAERLARHVGDAFEDLNARVTISGTGEGAFPRVVKWVLDAARLRDVSAPDAARREAERRRDAALHSGEDEPEPRKISTG